MSQATTLDSFHPYIQEWFKGEFTAPTPIQEQSWPKIENGQNLLITAPTGSGKTLTAFLISIDRLVKHELPRGEISTLYVSPLKALNNDINRNLSRPLQQIESVFNHYGEEWSPIRSAVRSGDTPPSERQRTLRRPPEIFITTPESLAILLTSKTGRAMLSTIQTVILDEIHAVIHDRRGSQLTVSLERLAELCGEFQRLALSATVNPQDKVARFVAGIDLNGKRRPMEVVDSKQEKEIELKVVLPESVKASIVEGESIWPGLVESFKEHIRQNRSTLIFANSRRQSERLVSLLNEGEKEILAYAHHGSLSREIRTEVETRLKSGRLKAIVATSSLELGIDIGELDEVVLLQSPDSIASTLQRIGRAGHKVGDVSRGTLYPMFARDLIDAAVVAEGVNARDLEPIHMVEQPLDLLAQTIVSMVATEDWRADDLYSVVTRSSTFEKLSRRSFELVLQMLSGKYEQTRIRDLKPRVDYDPETGSIESRKGAALVLYANSGTIPDLGYFKLRHADSKALIGELDEEFVWETQPGKKFAFGTQQWVVDSISHNDVLVREDYDSDSIPPFYRSEFINKSFYYALNSSSFLEMADNALASNQPHLIEVELKKRGFDARAAEELIRCLMEQREETGVPLPHAKHVVFELIHTAPGGYRSVAEVKQLVIHTGWGGAVNRPIAMCMASEWESRWDAVPDIAADNEVITVQIKQEVSVEEVIELLSPNDLHKKLRKSLEKSSYFGARFRECAGRALLVSKKQINRRMPLWLIRMQAKDLMSAVLKYEDFPILLESWRTCLQDEFDLEAAQQVLDDLESGAIRMSCIESMTPSPFAKSIAQQQLNRYVYLDDSPDSRGGVSSLSDELISQAIRNPSLRPVIKSATIERLERKLQRRESGYEPTTDRELAAWLLERVWIPKQEWFETSALPPKMLTIEHRGSIWYSHPRNAKLIETEPFLAISNALQFYGPRTREELLDLFPVERSLMEEVISTLSDSGDFVDDVLVEGRSEKHLCDKKNLDSLFRFQRRDNRVEVQTQPIKSLPAFLARLHNLGVDQSDRALLYTLERLQGFVAPVKVWLRMLWQSRHGDVSFERWSRLCAEYGIGWQGQGEKRIRLGQLETFEPVKPITAEGESVLAGFKDPEGHYSYLQLQQAFDGPSYVFNESFWDLVWCGHIAGASIEVLRKVLAHSSPELTSLDRQLPQSFRLRLETRKDTTPRAAGLWYRIQPRPKPDNALDQLEDRKEIARILLIRYGFVCRELCKREGGQFKWSNVFPALRAMELAGEIFAGLFFTELSGPQFATAESIRLFGTGFQDQEHFWINSYDPISPCGLNVDWDELPARSQNTNFAFNKGELVAIARYGGRDITFLQPPESELLTEPIRTLHDGNTRERRMSIQVINKEIVHRSPYLPLIEKFHTVRHGAVDMYLEKPFFD